MSFLSYCTCCGWTILLGVQNGWKVVRILPLHFSGHVNFLIRKACDWKLWWQNFIGFKNMCLHKSNPWGMWISVIHLLISPACLVCSLNNMACMFMLLFVGLVVLPFHCLHWDLFLQLIPTYSVASHCVPWSKSIIFTCHVSSLHSCQQVESSGKTLLALTWLSWLSCLKWYFRQLKDNLRQLRHLSQVKARSVFPDKLWAPLQCYRWFFTPIATLTTASSWNQFVILSSSDLAALIL